MSNYYNMSGNQLRLEHYISKNKELEEKNLEEKNKKIEEQNKELIDIIEITKEFNDFYISVLNSVLNCGGNVNYDLHLGKLNKLQHFILNTKKEIEDIKELKDKINRLENKIIEKDKQLFKKEQDNKEIQIQLKDTTDLYNKIIEEKYEL